MKSLKVSLMLLMFLAAGVHQSWSLEDRQCYYCKDNTTLSCSKGDPNTYLKIPCVGDLICLTIVDSDGKIEKNCGTEERCRSSHFCYSCQENLCNSSSSLVPFYVITVFAAAIARFY